MSTSSIPAQVESAPPKPPKGPSALTIGLIAGIISGIFSGVMCTVICLLFLFVVIPASRTVSSLSTVTEEGSVTVTIAGETRKGETQVFYKRPFASPPHLGLEEGYDCVISEQKADSFKVSRDVSGRGSWTSATTVKWKAEGTPAN